MLDASGLGVEQVLFSDVPFPLIWMGLVLDEAANDAGGPCISKSWSAVSAWVVPTNEERMIAISVAELLRVTLSNPDRKEK